MPDWIKAYLVFLAVVAASMVLSVGLVIASHAYGTTETAVAGSIVGLFVIAPMAFFVLLGGDF